MTTHHRVRQDGRQQVARDEGDALQGEHQRHRAVAAPAPPLARRCIGRHGRRERVDAPGADAQDEAGNGELCVDRGGKDEGAPEGAGDLVGWLID